MKASLTTRVATRLTLTPQLSTSLNVLAMNAVELESFLAQSLEENPLLERVGEEEREDGVEVTLREAVEESWWLEPPPDDAVGPEAQLRDTPSLSEWLHGQLARQPMPQHERQLAMAIVDSLDDDGLFRVDIASFADTFGVAPETVERVLVERVQALEPAGIAARDTLECLLLQLDPTQPEDRLARMLLLEHQQWLGDRERLLESLRVPAAQLDAALARLRRLDPFPGHLGGAQIALYITPELRVRRDGDGFSVELVSPARVRVSRRWRHVRWPDADRSFMQQARQQAYGLVQALRQREETLLRVGQCLVRRQADMLTAGLPAVRPLTLRDVAEELGVHESTVSRAVQGKYADTPIGTLPLKAFFSAGLRTQVGGTISTSRVRQRIRALIEAEDKTRPISDQRIAEILCREGIEVARRTVAKYREQLGLPSSSRRRRPAVSRQKHMRR
ncbi:MAG: RNA polymerase sigma-54 factor [Zetaproteobacteria bacterium]|nr:MAG: RNA polymerase sigma-54 factor [Zetaproteobacteria bacterium]